MAGRDSIGCLRLMGGRRSVERGDGVLGVEDESEYGGDESAYEDENDSKSIMVVANEKEKNKIQLTTTR